MIFYTDIAGQFHPSFLFWVSYSLPETLLFLRLAITLFNIYEIGCSKYTVSQILFFVKSFGEENYLQQGFTKSIIPAHFLLKLSKYMIRFDTIS